MKIVFVCTMGRHRSKTASDLLNSYGYTTDYCGTNRDADRKLDAEILHEADRIICFESHHRNNLRRKFKGLSSKIYVWHIPDDYHYMQPELVDWIAANANQYLRRDYDAPSLS